MGVGWGGSWGRLDREDTCSRPPNREFAQGMGETCDPGRGKGTRRQQLYAGQEREAGGNTLRWGRGVERGGGGVGARLFPQVTGSCSRVMTPSYLCCRKLFPEERAVS